MKIFCSNTLLLTLATLLGSASAETTIAFKLGLASGDEMPGQAATNAFERVIDWALDQVDKEAGEYQFPHLSLPSAVLPSKFSVNKPSAGGSLFSGAADASDAEQWKEEYGAKTTSDDLSGSWHSYVSHVDGTVELVDDSIGEEDRRRLREEAAQQALPLPEGQGERHLQNCNCWFWCQTFGTPYWCDCCSCCDNGRRRLRTKRGLESASDEDLQAMADRIRDVALVGLHQFDNHRQMDVFQFEGGYLLEVILVRESDSTSRTAKGEFKVAKKTTVGKTEEGKLDETVVSKFKKGRKKAIKEAIEKGESSEPGRGGRGFGGRVGRGRGGRGESSESTESTESESSESSEFTESESSESSESQPSSSEE